MKLKISALAIGCLTLSAAAFQMACNKGNSAGTIGSTTTTASNSIAVASSVSVANADTVYIMQSCGPGGSRDSVAESSLPSSVATYLTNNYSGYLFHEAFTINDSSNALTGYVVIIYYNDKPIGLEFSSTGEFVRVLEQTSGNHGHDHYNQSDSTDNDTDNDVDSI